MAEAIAALGVGCGVGGAGELRARDRAAQVFDQARRHLFEEARGDAGLGHVGAVAAAVAGAGHDQGVHGAGHADVAEAAFLLEAVGVDQGARAGEEAFFHAGEKDQRELEALGGVQGHQGHARLGGVLVGVGDQGGVVEELGQGLAAFLRVLGGVGEFLEVFDAGEGLGRGLLFERADVAGAVVEELDQFGEGGRVAGLAESFDPSRAPVDSSIRISAARSGVVFAERFEDDRGEWIECGGVDGVGGVGVAGFSGAMVEISSVGPKSKPKLKLVSKEVSGSVAAGSSVAIQLQDRRGRSLSALRRLVRVAVVLHASASVGIFGGSGRR